MSMRAPFFAVLCVLAAKAVAAPALQQGAAPVQLSAAMDAVDGWLVRLTLHNDYEHATRVLLDNTPFDARTGAQFFEARTEKGDVLPYEGIIVKRAPATAEDFTEIAARGTLTVTLDLSTGYRFQQGVRYSIATPPRASAVVHALQGEATATVAFRASLLSFRASRTAQLLWERHSPALEEVVTTNCNATQAAIIKAAYDKVGPVVDNILDNYFKCNCTFKPFTTYFGATYSEARCKKVKDTFTNMRTALAGKVNISCGGPSCNPKDYAYTTKAGVTIYMCASFWKAGTSVSLDSQPGVIIHELTHWASVGGTSDVVYGDAKCKALAISDADKATTNADSYEYFAENKPAANPCNRTTPAPTRAPTASPSAHPTASPTTKPTHAPTAKVTVKPSQAPTSRPSFSTQAPAVLTVAPALAPSEGPGFSGIRCDSWVCTEGWTTITRVPAGNIKCLNDLCNNPTCCNPPTCASSTDVYSCPNGVKSNADRIQCPGQYVYACTDVLCCA